MCLHNALTNLGTSVGTAVPEPLTSQAEVEFAAGIQFIHDSDLEAALTQAGITGDTAQAINEENSQSRIAGLRAALAALAALAIAALFSTGSLPTRQGQSGTDAKVPTGSA